MKSVHAPIGVVPLLLLYFIHEIDDDRFLVRVFAFSFARHKTEVSEYHSLLPYCLMLLFFQHLFNSRFNSKPVWLVQVHQMKIRMWKKAFIPFDILEFSIHSAAHHIYYIV